MPSVITLSLSVEIVPTFTATKSHLKESYDKQNLTFVVISYEIYGFINSILNDHSCKIRYVLNLLRHCWLIYLMSAYIYRCYESLARVIGISCQTFCWTFRQLANLKTIKTINKRLRLCFRRFRQMKKQQPSNKKKKKKKKSKIKIHPWSVKLPVLRNRLSSFLLWEKGIDLE